MSNKYRRGINLGGFLSQCIHTEEHYATFITKEDLYKIADMGFDHVRIAVDYNFFEAEDGKFIDEHFAFLDNILVECKKAGLDVMLDLHKARGYDFNDAGDAQKNSLFNSEELQEGYLRLWDKISSEYGKYSDYVAFELLNEVVEDENADAWNELIKRATKTIRQQAPDSLIVYGGIRWNSVSTVKLLEKPEDDNVMFTFHFYEPLIFTHQKAYWVKAMDPNKTIVYPESMEYYFEQSKPLGVQGGIFTDTKLTQMGADVFEYMIAEAKAAADEAGVDLYCGEMGVIDLAPTKDTLNWFRDADEAYRRNDIGYCVWSYKKMDFGIIDEHYDDIRDELIKIWNNK